MMPELGKYAFEVSMAYVVSLTLLGALVAFTVVKGRNVRAQLRAFEEARKKGE